MIYKLFLNIEFWSAICGFTGSIMLFFFGLPSRINPEGHINLILEQTDKEEVRKGEIYKRLGYVGLLLIVFSFAFQVIKLII